MAKQETPRPKGGQKPPPEEADFTVIDPYEEFDRLDEETIRREHRGSGKSPQLCYLIPFKSKDGGRTDYGKPFHKHCKLCREGKVKHTHAVGIGVHGIDEITRHYGYLGRKILGSKKEHKEGNTFWISEAVAMDGTNGNAVSSVAEQVCRSKRGADDARADLDRVIAERKAERNSLRKLLPQPLLLWIEDRAVKTGILTFKPSEVRGYLKKHEPERLEMIPRFGIFPGIQIYQTGAGMPTASLPSGPPQQPPAAPAPRSSSRPSNNPPPHEDGDQHAGGRPVAESKKGSPPAAAAKNGPDDIKPESYRARIEEWLKSEKLPELIPKIDAWWESMWNSKPEDMLPGEFIDALNEGKRYLWDCGDTPEQARKEFARIVEAASEAFNGEPGKREAGVEGGQESMI